MGHELAKASAQVTYVRPHVQAIRANKPVRAAFARILDAGIGDEVDDFYYDDFSDPDYRYRSWQRRLRTGQYLRRVRRMAADAEHGSSRPPRQGTSRRAYFRTDLTMLGAAGRPPRRAWDLDILAKRLQRWETDLDLRP